MGNKDIVLNEIEEKRGLITDLSDKIWEFAELSLKEERSADLFCNILREQGFEVEEGLSGIPTAFKASFGSGRPMIGILAEYDALSGLSQEGCCTEKNELVPDGNGHGCGHNMLGAGAFGAALGVKKYLTETGVSGTVILYGCPGEEGVASKAFMARDKEWDKLDAALTWHPSDCNEVATGGSNACIQSAYTFFGTASHAAAAPEKGRSALDALELMNIGVQFLREHMSDRARIHYSILDAGGVSPNVVQPRAQALYMVRSDKVREAVELKKRVDKIAEGAALMTETTFQETFVDGLSDTVSNRTLEEVLFKNFEELGVPDYSKEELEFATRLSDTYESRDEVPGIGSDNDRDYRDKVKELRREKGDCPLNPFLLPHFKGDAFEPASTDVGDVSWRVPTGQIHVAVFPNGCPGHSWQNVSAGRSSIGHKAVIKAAEVLSCTAVDLFEDPELLRKAREEFEMRTRDGYVCPIPEGAVAKAP